MHDLWQDITTTAVLGTERQAPTLSDSGGALGDLLASLPREKPERALLSAAAAISLSLRAGRIADQDAELIPKPCSLEDLPTVSPFVEQKLAVLIGGKYVQILPEALTAIAAQKQRVPDILLPALLDYGRQQTSIRPLIADVIGQRGRWLSGFRSEWGYVVGDDEAVTWEEGKASARLGLLQRLRANDPTAARELLASTWATESAEDRSAFLGTFKQGLSLDDEAFLEAALDDRSKEVRRTAANLLAQLPDSQLSKRMLARAESLLQWKRKLLGAGELEVVPPNECDKKMDRDGIEPKPPTGIGEKGWWLQQILSFVPPSQWVAICHQTPDILLQTGLTNEWKVPLLAGWNAAASLHRDSDWMVALTRLTFSTTKSNDRRNIPNIAVSLLPSDHLETLIMEYLEPKGLLLKVTPQIPLHDAHRAMELLRQHVHPWSEQLSRAIIQSLRSRILAGNQPNYPTWRLMQDVRVYGYYVPITLTDEFQQGWPQDAEQWPAWESHVTEFLHILQFRRDLHKEIAR